MEVAIVGDISESRALELVATYIGSLPPRPRQDARLAPLRQVAGFTGPLERTLDVETITPRAHPILLWRSADWQDVRGRRLMFVASRILERRVRQAVREERGLTYSTSTYAQPSKVYPTTSALYVTFTADPIKWKRLRRGQVGIRTFCCGQPNAEMETVRSNSRMIRTMYKEPFLGRVLSDLNTMGTP
jgi:predicted Zn-dependent peptidase